MTVESTSNEHLGIVAALGGLAETIKRAYATNDSDLYLSAFDEDAIVSMPGVVPVRGHAALKALFENRPELPAGATFRVDPLEIEPLNSDWAYAFGADILDLPDGTKETMTFLVLIRKTPRGWKTFREVVSADQ